jgi:hypothetical protein
VAYSTTNEERDVSSPTLPSQSPSMASAPDADDSKNDAALPKQLFKNEKETEEASKQSSGSD